LLDDFEINNKVIYSNPYHYENPEDSNDAILYKNGLNFLNCKSDDITSNIYFCTLDGLVIKK
tara:strand:+ start:462 stop:647 length:186 start_codon:yes stop_codon:yes gene_type:complete